MTKRVFKSLKKHFVTLYFMCNIRLSLGIFSFKLSENVLKKQDFATRGFHSTATIGRSPVCCQISIRVYCTLDFLRLNKYRMKRHRISVNGP